MKFLLLITCFLTASLTSSELAKLPSSGPCNEAVYNSLRASCDTLTHDSHKKYALNFTTCFLLDIGKHPEICQSDDITECLKVLNPTETSIYQKFYLNIENFCVLEKKMPMSMDLSEYEKTSQSTAKLTEEALTQTKKILDNQEEIQSSVTIMIDTAKRAVEGVKQVSNFLEQTRKILTHQLDQVMELLNEQKEKILANIQLYVPSAVVYFFTEFLDISTATFYFILFLSLFIATIPSSFAPARWLLLTIFFLALALDRLAENALKYFEFSTLLGYFERGLYYGRACIILLMVFALLETYFTYEDPRLKMLRELGEMRNMMARNVEERNRIREAYVDTYLTDSD